MNGFNWSPGIGDPTFMGWLTVALYLATAWASWRLAHLLGAIRSPIDREALLWRAIALLFLALGVNKQIDLQSALTEAGRYLARRQGWYEQREVVQMIFVGVIAISCAIAVCILMVWARKLARDTWLAIAGTVGVLCYVLIRAASFHHIDRFIGETVLGARWNWILEIVAIAIVLVAGLRRHHRLVTGPLEPALASQAGTAKTS